MIQFDCAGKNKRGQNTLLYTLRPFLLIIKRGLARGTPYAATEKMFFSILLTQMDGLVKT